MTRQRQHEHVFQGLRLTCPEVKGPGRQGVGSPQMCAVAQRQADLHGSLDLELVGTRAQQDADGRHRLQLDTSHHCKKITT